MIRGGQSPHRLVAVASETVGYGVNYCWRAVRLTITKTNTNLALNSDQSVWVCLATYSRFLLQTKLNFLYNELRNLHCPCLDAAIPSRTR